MNGVTERCPWCESIISRTKFLEIEAKIRDEEQKKLADAEIQMRRRLEGEFQLDLAKQKQASEKAAQEQAAKQVAAITDERDKMAEKVKQVELREVAIRKQAREETAKQLGSVAAERDQIAAKLKQAEAREADIRKEAEDNATKRIVVVMGERDQLAAKVKAAEANEKAIRLQAQQEAERTIKARLDEGDRQRQKELADRKIILMKDRDETVLKERAGFSRERESWEKKLKELEHKVQRKTAQEMGDGAEIDLYEVLRAEFPRDKIDRIKKGQPGADILHEVLYKGESCGRIIVDSKNRQRWGHEYVSKLRQDQT